MSHSLTKANKSIHYWMTQKSHHLEPEDRLCTINHFQTIFLASNKGKCKYVRWGQVFADFAC